MWYSSPAFLRVDPFENAISLANPIVIPGVGSGVSRAEQKAIEQAEEPVPA